jgi:hypothetical protein
VEILISHPVLAGLVEAPVDRYSPRRVVLAQQLRSVETLHFLLVTEALKAVQLLFLPV